MRDGFFKNQRISSPKQEKNRRNQYCAYTKIYSQCENENTQQNKKPLKTNCIDINVSHPRRN